MENKYIVTIGRGVLNFNNKEQVEDGKIIPFKLEDKEIADKIKRKLIKKFDPEDDLNSENIQVERNKSPEVEKAFQDLTKKLEDLEKEIQSLREENDRLKKQLEEMQTADLERQEENDRLKAEIEKLKKGGKK